MSFDITSKGGRAIFWLAVIILLPLFAWLSWTGN